MLRGHYHCNVNLQCDKMLALSECGSILNGISCSVLPCYAVTFMAYTLFTPGKITVPSPIMALGSLVLFIVLIMPELNIFVLHTGTRANMTFGAHPLSGKHGNRSAHWAAPSFLKRCFNPFECFDFSFAIYRTLIRIDLKKGKKRSVKFKNVFLEIWNPVFKHTILYFS